MIRSLPKRIRRNLVPAPDTAKRVAATLTFGQGSFVQEVASRLAIEADEKLTLEDFELEKIDAYLTMGVEVVDPNGIVLAHGRQLADVRRQLEDAGVSAGNQIQDSDWQVGRQTDWTFGTIPREIKLTRNGIQVLAFPALIDEGDTVGIGLFDNVELAAVQHQLGLTRLLRITHAKQLRRLVRELSGFDSAKWLMGRWLSSAELEVGLECVLVKMAI